MSKDRLFKRIWKDYSKKIYFFISHTLPAEKENYDDLFQEIMMKIFQRVDQYNKKYSLDTWLYSITRNYCIDYLKRKRIQYNYLDNDIASEESTENIIGKIDDSSKIHECLQSLNYDERQIVYLHYFESMTFKKISVILDMNINTVKTKMRHLKRKLKDDLKDVL